MKVIVLDVNSQVPLIVDDFGEKQSNLQDLYKYIKCRCVDCVRRKIGDKYFDIWVDDEGLLKEEKKYLQGYCLNGYEVLVGNLVIANVDEEGGMIGLTDDEIENILTNVISWKSLFGNVDEDELEVVYKGYEDINLVANMKGVVLRYEY